MGILFSLTNLFSSKDQWGVIGKYYNTSFFRIPPSILKICLGFMYGMVGSAFLIYLNWPILVIGGLMFALIAVITHRDKIRDKWKIAILFGLFLMSFDWIFENIGSIVNFWHSYNSILFIAAVPLEVMIGATCGGFGYALFLPKKWGTKYILLLSLIPAVGGTLGENTLQLIGNMNYAGGWIWVHAMVAYFLTWIMLNIVWYFLINKKSFMLRSC